MPDREDARSPSPTDGDYGSTGNSLVLRNVSNQPAPEEPAAASLTVADAVERIGVGPFQVKVLSLCGFLYCAEAMEMLLLAVLAPALKCEWLLSEVQVALITTVVFIGYTFMSPLWGISADLYGRRTITVIICIWLVYYGLLTAFSPNFVWVLILRGLVGCGMAGGPQAFVLASEYIPLKWRGKLLIALAIFWSVGAIFEIGLAWIIMLTVGEDSPIKGWRLLVFLSSVPLAIASCFLGYIPESARFLVAAGREKEALEVLNDATRLNKQPEIKENLAPEFAESRGSVRELFKPELLATTLGCYFLWFTAGFVYYGMVLLSATLLEVEKKDCGATVKTVEVSAETCACSPMTSNDFTLMVVTTVGEMMAIPLNMVTLDLFGRKRSMALYMVLQFISFMMLIPCGLPEAALTAVDFFIRGISGAFFNAVYIYVAEAYPTHVRALAIGSCSSFARIGSIITPFIAQVLVAHDRRAAIAVYGAVALMAAIVSLLLPIETKDRLQTT